jgi:DNA-binding CsgD family transcriptional regulator
VSQLRAGTSKQALARIQRLCCLGIGSEALMPDLIREVIRLVPSRAGWFFWLGSDLRITNVYVTFPASILEVYFKEFHHSRLENELLGTVPRPFWPTKRVLRLWEGLRVDTRTFLRSEYYNAICRPADLYQGLVLLISGANQKRGMLHVNRGEGDPSYEPKDVTMLEAIAGFVAHAMTSATLGDDAFADSDDRALFVVDLDGTVRHASQQAQFLLMMALVPHWSPTADWRALNNPAPEIAQLCRALAATANGQIGQPPPVLRLRNPWGEFVLRAYWFGSTDGTEQTGQIGITIERRVPRAVALRRRVEDLPLTAREKQLCLLLAHHRPRQDLADAMGVSTGTVITHQSSIYAKLGVHSRAELLAALVPE